MKIYDVTLPLTADLPVYPGDPPVLIEPVARLAAGDPYDLLRLSMSSHAGTHVDAPAHLFQGATTVDALALEILLGKVRVVDVAAAEHIGRADLEALDLRADLRVLIRTRSGRLPDPGVGVWLTEDAASYLVQAGLKLVGIDSLSVDPLGTGELRAHRVLLGAGVILVEGLDLADVEPGEYEMACLPLRVTGGDGAPARVVLKTRR